MGGEYMLK